MLFPQLYGKCQVITHKDGARPALFPIRLLIVLFLLLIVLSYVLFVCKCVLPPGDNPIVDNKYIISSYCSLSSRGKSNRERNLIASIWWEVKISGKCTTTLGKKKEFLL